jgi:tetratricopeptide (TPR) repeat protein
VCRTQGDYPQAIALFRSNISALDGPRMAERFGMHALPAVLARGFLADCLSLTGEFSEGAIHGRAALEIAEAVRHPYSIMSACGGPAALQIRQGHLGMAIPFLERAVARCRTWDISSWFPSIAAELALAYAMVGRIAEALALLEEVGGEITTPGTIAADLSLAFLLAGRVDTATTLAEGSLATSRRRNERGNVASVLHVLGEIAARREPPDVDTATNFYEQAMRQAAELGMRPLVAHCHLGLGKLYRRTGDDAQSRAHLTTATTMYREMDMRFWLEQVEAEKRELGA